MKTSTAFWKLTKPIYAQPWNYDLNEDKTNVIMFNYSQT